MIQPAETRLTATVPNEEYWRRQFSFRFPAIPGCRRTPRFSSDPGASAGPLRAAQRDSSAAAGCCCLWHFRCKCLVARKLAVVRLKFDRTATAAICVRGVGFGRQ